MSATVDRPGLTAPVVAVVFFDIGDTLASVRIDRTGTAIEDMVVLPGVVDALERFRDSGVAQGTLSNPGLMPTAAVDAALDDCGLASFLDPRLRVWGRKDSAAIFHRAVQAAGAVTRVAPSQVVFVGEDTTERSVARSVGLRVSPSPGLAVRALLGSRPLQRPG